MTGTTLLDWLQGILRDPAERAAFQADPDDYADRHGFGGLSPADVHDALWLIADNQSASWEQGNPQVHYPPPPPIHQHLDHAGGYLNSYITGSYTAAPTGDDGEPDTDRSAHQDVRTEDHEYDDHGYDDHGYDDHGDPRVHVDAENLWGGEDLWSGEDLHQHSDTVAAGDGATAVAGDDDGTIASAGHDGTTAFGAGDAVHADVSGTDTEFGAGSSVDVGDGSSSGHAEIDTHLAAADSFQADDSVLGHDGDPAGPHDPLSDGPLDGGGHDTEPHDQGDHIHFDDV